MTNLKLWHTKIKKYLIQRAKRNYYKSYPTEKLFNIRHSGYKFTSRPDVVYLRKNGNPFAIFELETKNSKNLYSSIIKGILLARFYHGCRFILIVSDLETENIAEDFINLVRLKLNCNLPEYYILKVKNDTKEQIQNLGRNLDVIAI